MRGLPQKQAYETVLRDGLTADSYDPAGLYFGTRSGQLFGSRDEGKNWQKIHDSLPSIVCVRTAIIEDGTIMPIRASKEPEPSPSRSKSASRAGIAFARGTVSDALTALWTVHPGVRDRVVNEQGQVRRHINIFIGNENIRDTGGLASPVSDDTQISIVPAVSGG